ncbi:MAG: hypothetical protein GXO44_05560 [Deferribacteres bacterium]|nr:hypothetical protein [Deferribacteres bacterium]
MILEQLIEIGSEYVHFGEKEGELPADIDVHEDEINEMISRIEKAKEVLASDSLIEKSDEDVEEALDNLSDLIYAKVALEEVLNIDSPIVEKIRDISEELYDWFFINFEPARLIPFNDLRRPVAKRFPEEYKHDFPWWTLYAEVPSSIFEDIAIALALSAGASPSDILSDEEFKWFAVAENDELLKKHIETKIWEYSLFKEAVKKAFSENPELITVLLADELCMEEDGRIKGDAAVVYPLVLKSAYERMKKTSSWAEALAAAVILGPVSDEWIVKLCSIPEIESILDKIVKEFLVYEDSETLRNMIRMWNQAIHEETQTCSVREVSMQEEREFFRDFNEYWLEDFENFQKEKSVGAVAGTVWLWLLTQAVRMPKYASDDKTVSAYFKFKAPKAKRVCLEDLWDYELIDGKREDFEDVIETIETEYYVALVVKEDLQYEFITKEPVEFTLPEEVSVDVPDDARELILIFSVDESALKEFINLVENRASEEEFKDFFNKKSVAVFHIVMGE